MQLRKTQIYNKSAPDLSKTAIIKQSSSCTFLPSFLYHQLLVRSMSNEPQSPAYVTINDTLACN